MRIVVAGAHPDDPETGCGGTIARCVQKGHDVSVVYLTRGERGIPGKSLEEAADIRSSEAGKACEILGCKAIFMSQVDGECKISSDVYKELQEILQTEKPDIIITHWPIDSHRDHQICSILGISSWEEMRKSFSLYFYEVMAGEQTTLFHPSDYIDITDYISTKHKACYVHTSQKPGEWYDKSHGRMERFRGMEAGCACAEAFVRHPGGRQVLIP